MSNAKKDSRRKFLRNSALGMAGLTASSFTVISDQKITIEDTYSKAIKGEKPFFAFDDRSIPWKENLKLTMTQPDKHPANPVIARGPKGSVDEWCVQFYGSAIFHEGKYKLWYIAGDLLSPSAGGFGGLKVAYAESTDGINWLRPNLGLIQHNGNKQNNLVRLGPDNTGGIHVLVIHEPEEPNAARRFKMMLTVVGAPEKAVYGNKSTSIPFFSADGFNWDSPIKYRFKNGNLDYADRVMNISTSFEQCGLYKRDGLYYLTGQVFDPQPSGLAAYRRMAVKRSKDLIEWDKSESFSFMTYGTEGQAMKGGWMDGHGGWLDGEQAHLPASIWDRGEILLGIYGLWHGAAKWEGISIDLGIMVSNDGVYFREPIPNHLLIKRGDAGEWDEGGLLQGQGFFNIGDKTFIYYGSWDPTKRNKPPRGGVGLATLRRDGFGYLSARTNEDSAHFITRVIQKKEILSKKIKININIEGVSSEAPLRIEILDETLTPVPEYAGENAGLVSKDGVSQEVIWPLDRKGNVAISGDFSIKVTYAPSSSARIYALYLSETT